MKIYDKYKMFKNSNDKIKYLFEVGNFYIFIDEDAKYIASITTLKLTSFGRTVKCGFPIGSLDKYLEIFNNLNVDIKIVETRENIIKELNELDLRKLSKDELILIIDRFKKCI